MTADVTIIRYLGPIIADVAAMRRRSDDVMACIQRWALDMACREMVAIHTIDGSADAMIRAIRARGRYGPSSGCTDRLTPTQRTHPLTL
jgi:hypothetical protein